MSEVSSLVPPPSILLLPAGGLESEQHFQASVAKPWSLSSLGLNVGFGGSGLMGVWGLRDNTRTLAGADDTPLSWARIEAGTVALFSNSSEYFASGEIVGKHVDAAASERLWGSQEFRWLIFLQSIQPVSIPLEVVRSGANFNASYKLNRQALVPKPHREAPLWEAIASYLNPGAAANVVVTREIPVEGFYHEIAEVVMVGGVHDFKRKEARLVHRLKAWWMKRDGDDAVCRLEFRPPNSVVRLYCDLFNRVTMELVEAKASTSRESVRMALGQLADYRRFAPKTSSCLVLLPEAPSEDLAALLRREGVGVIVPAAQGFAYLD
jgi:hypothetical protein